ncbi:MAG: aminomethyl-transferring glycine dehydrogenase [Bacteroidia bacterium]|nr:aminomethyl-transferring glycine dehydrogenase [Bacteroidia bacterium]
MNAYTDSFLYRHLGPSPEDLDAMLRSIGADSLETLISQTVPASIRLTEPLRPFAALTEHQYLQRLRSIARRNRRFRSCIGQGYYDCITPSVILRNIFENPGWYTQYTPYQAEIAQGRMEALLNFQTMVSDLTALPVANASLLDEATAAGEAMAMTHAMFLRRNRKSTANVLLVADTLFPQTISVLRTRAAGLGLELRVGSPDTFQIDDQVFAAIVQYPDSRGQIHDYQALADALHERGCFLIAAADLLSLTLLKAPGEWGADVALGSAQRFGVPMGYGGPHAAFFAAREDFLREMPGRIIGVSIDAQGRRALRMALQTREQHIRREKATSNICTAQALLAIMASMYGVYHGPRGLKAIASRIHAFTRSLALGLGELGYALETDAYFDTLTLRLHDAAEQDRLRGLATELEINLFYSADARVSLSLDETTSPEDVALLIDLFARLRSRGGAAAMPETAAPDCIPDALLRTSAYLTHPVFNSHQSETAMMRYIKRLESKDLALNTAMIPLGSCTMKLNAATQLIPVSWPEFAGLHPFAPADQAEGYTQVFEELGEILCDVTGFAGISFQPNSGAQGEYAGLMVIRAWHHSRGEAHRTIALIPSSAHGTNPASAVMAGMQVVVVGCDEMGNIDLADLRAKAEQHSRHLACLMITYPSTHGVFEETVLEACSIVHAHGGQVYMDGANMNAQVGLTSPGRIGADVCHLNLHKTFAIPHGGGGPGMGPICVAAHLKPFLPGHPLVQTGGAQGITPVSATPYGSASILLISYAYCMMLGSEGLRTATEYAILNANYMKSRLEPYFDVLYQGANGRVAHEFILDLREFKQQLGLEVDDVTKRLIDYGFHAPTVSWPVPGTIMIEPTESEPKAELDRFCDALISIRSEIGELENGTASAEDNVLRNAPHTLEEVTASAWTHAYSREQAAFPAASLREHKFWASVKRVNNTYGDRNVVCVCPPMEAYMES